jgi:hypothetical protein
VESQEPLPIADCQFPIGLLGKNYGWAIGSGIWRSASVRAKQGRLPNHLLTANFRFDLSALGSFEILYVSLGANEIKSPIENRKCPSPAANIVRSTKRYSDLVAMKNRGECRKDYIRHLSPVENGNFSGGNTVLNRLFNSCHPFSLIFWSKFV